jgi:hypothetical protein
MLREIIRDVSAIGVLAVIIGWLYSLIFSFAITKQEQKEILKTVIVSISVGLIMIIVAQLCNYLFIN